VGRPRGTHLESLYLSLARQCTLRCAREGLLEFSSAAERRRRAITRWSRLRHTRIARCGSQPTCKQTMYRKAYVRRRRKEGERERERRVCLEGAERGQRLRGARDCCGMSEEVSIGARCGTNHASQPRGKDTLSSLAGSLPTIMSASAFSGSAGTARARRLAATARPPTTEINGETAPLIPQDEPTTPFTHPVRGVCRCFRFASVERLAESTQHDRAGSRV
jgi:hypothetical protein